MTKRCRHLGCRLAGITSCECFGSRGGAPVSLCGVGDTRASQKTVGGWLRNSARLLEGHRLRRIEAVGRHAGEET